MQADERVEGLEIRQTLEDACHPRLVALLVYDMQVGILGQIEDGEAVTRRVRDVLQAARAAGVRTVFVRHVTMPRRLMGAAQLRMWKAWQRRESAAERFRRRRIAALPRCQRPATRS